MKRFLTGFFGAVAISGLVLCGAEAETIITQFAVSVGCLVAFSAGAFGLVMVNREHRRDGNIN